LVKLYIKKKRTDGSRNAHTSQTIHKGTTTTNRTFSINKRIEQLLAIKTSYEVESLTVISCTTSFSTKLCGSLKSFVSNKDVEAEALDSLSF